jgi:hypothetical protein
VGRQRGGRYPSGGGVRLQRRPECGAWSVRASTTLGAGADESVRVRVRTFVKAGSSAEPKSATRRRGVRCVEGL